MVIYSDLFPPLGGGRGMKFRKPFRPKIRKITPARYRTIAEAVLINRVSFWIGRHCMASIILMSRQYAGTDFIVARDGRIATVYLFFDKL